MLKRHEDALMQRFDALSNKGFTFIQWWELNDWYDIDRISKKVWRDLRDRFVEEDANAELYIYEVSEGILLINSDGLAKIAVDGERNPVPQTEADA
jgi:hypothetical protein